MLHTDSAYMMLVYFAHSGFGNAAGLMASYGLMGGQRSSSQTYSDDSDSETEEYKELEPNINPVTGITKLWLGSAGRSVKIA